MDGSQVLIVVSGLAVLALLLGLLFKCVKGDSDD